MNFTEKREIPKIRSCMRQNGNKFSYDNMIYAPHQQFWRKYHTLALQWHKGLSEKRFKSN